MGALGSKELLGQIVVIYGYNNNDFCWKEIDNRSLYHTSGLVIGYHGKKYVITTRNRLIGCKNIVMYHSYFRGSEPVMRNDLEILFHSIEVNIIILGSKGCGELDFTMSEIIHGDYDPKIICPTHDIAVKEHIVPTKRSRYYTVRMDMDLNTETINYCVHIYDVKYVGSEIYNKTYLPRNYMYKYILKNKESELFGICGAVIFNKKCKLIGLISKCENDIFYVLPRKVLLKIANDFILYKANQIKYIGLLSLPCTLKNTNKKMIKIENIDNENNKIFNKNDVVVAINGNTIVTENNEFLVYDPNYQDHIPIDIYIRLDSNRDVPIIITIVRNKKTIDVEIYGLKSNYQNCQLTNQPYFLPQNLIPFVNINNIIIVELTHELIDITMLNKITLKNETIDNFFDGYLDNSGSNLLVIDCLDSVVADKYNLPIMVAHTEQTLVCPIVTMINNNKVYTLSDINRLLTTNMVSTIKLGFDLNDSFVIDFN